MSLAGFELTLAGPRDLEPLAALVREDAVHYFGAEAPSLEATRHAVKRDWLGCSANCETALGNLDGRVVSFATFSVVYPAPALGLQLFMKGLYVAASARNLGVGTHMLRALAKLAVDRGCGRFDWTTDTDNPDAMRFYERHGARHVANKVYYRLDGEGLKTLAGSVGN